MGELSQFDKAEQVINNTINIEGGFSNHPNDKGGATKYGITLALYQKLVNKNATAQDLMGISSNEARQFYKEYFFYKYTIQDLPESIWDIVFDMTVNHGPTNAFSIVQLAVNYLGQKTSITGVNDAEMQGAIAKLDTRAVRASIIAQRVSFFDDIITHKPTQKVFAIGWFRNRCAYFIKHQVLN